MPFVSSATVSQQSLPDVIGISQVNGVTSIHKRDGTIVTGSVPAKQLIAMGNPSGLQIINTGGLNGMGMGMSMGGGGMQMNMPGGMHMSMGK